MQHRAATGCPIVTSLKIARVYQRPDWTGQTAVAHWTLHLLYYIDEDTEPVRTSTHPSINTGTLAETEIKIGKVIGSLGIVLLWLASFSLLTRWMPWGRGVVRWPLMPRLVETHNTSVDTFKFFNAVKGFKCLYIYFLFIMTRMVEGCRIWIRWGKVVRFVSESLPRLRSVGITFARINFKRVG